jgi:hypothetical protein
MQRLRFHWLWLTVVVSAVLSGCPSEPAPPACTALAGFELGYHNAPDNSSCGPDTAGTFLDGYLLGLKLSNIEQASIINGREIDYLETQLKLGKSTLSNTELQFQLDHLNQEKQRLSVSRLILENQAKALQRAASQPVSR